jgi:hypothetical protein
LELATVGDIASHGNFGEQLKRSTDALFKDLGLKRACELTGKSKSVLGRYASLSPEHENRYISVIDLIALEREASTPFVTKKLAELNGMVLSPGGA